MARLPAARSRPRAMGLATALMAALAAGAVWCLLALWFRRDLVALAFAVAAISAWILRAHGYARHWLGPVAAVACVAVATLYAFSLRAVMDISGLFGLPVGQAMRETGVAMTLDIALTRLHGWPLAVTALAAACAAWWTIGRRRG
ncbi:MAG: hypothetical protein J0H15_07505 [Xanthomonadales bacterium]|nr:hypothetical protein [Xanthomonadales bacterium]